MSFQRKKQSAALEFLTEKQNLILGIVGAIVLLVAGYFAYKNWFIEPKNKRAVDHMYQAQFAFDMDSFQMALNNPGSGGTGFLKIIDKYKGTESANLAHYYAGVSYLNLGQFDNAIKYLLGYSEHDPISGAMKYAALGDAYAEKKQDDKALSAYQKATQISKDNTTGPYVYKKLAMFQEKMGKWADCQHTWEEIRNKFPKSGEAITAELNIERAKFKAGNK